MKFAEIRARAEKRKGVTALKNLLPKNLAPKELESLGDDRYLAMMTKVVNQAGFSWKVIENKWPEFEEAFFKFDPIKLGLLSPEQWRPTQLIVELFAIGRKLEPFEKMYFLYKKLLES